MMRLFFDECFVLLCFDAIHFVFVVLTTCFQNELDFSNSNYREVFGKQEVACKEQTK